MSIRVCVCVCLRHVYSPHHKHQKHTCFAFEKAKWVVCVWVGFFLFFFFALRSFIKQYDFELFPLFPILYISNRSVCGTANLAHWKSVKYLHPFDASIHSFLFARFLFRLSQCIPPSWILFFFLKRSSLSALIVILCEILSETFAAKIENL